MKTHIIQIEHHDDIVSACDKMNWARGGRILLVWPEGRPTLNRRLDLTLLKRRSAALGAPLALVSKDPEVLYYAPRLGIPVFRTLAKAQADTWRSPRRFRLAMFAHKPAQAAEAQAEAGRKPRPERASRPEPDLVTLTPAGRLGVFALGVLAMLSIAAVLLPGATVQVAPQTQVQDALIDLYAGPEVMDVGLGGRVPAVWQSVIVEGRDALAASGSLRIPERAATGEIVFTNLTDREVSIPEGTVARTQGEEPVRFAVTRGGTAPAGPGESISLPAQALEPGERGNLPAGQLAAIEGLLGAQVSAANPEAMRGGLSAAAPAPSAQDRQALEARLTAALEASALDELRRGLEPGDVIVAESLERVQTLEANVQPKDGLPAERLVMSLRLEYRALAVRGADLAALAQGVFDANLAAGARAVDGSLKIENLGAPQRSEAGYRWQIHAHRRIMAQVQEQQVIRSILGRSPGQAAQALAAGLPMDEPAQIAVQPAWWPRLPILPFRIRVVHAYPGR